MELLSDSLRKWVPYFSVVYRYLLSVPYMTSLNWHLSSSSSSLFFLIFSRARLGKLIFTKLSAQYGVNYFMNACLLTKHLHTLHPTHTSISTKRNRTSTNRKNHRHINFFRTQTQAIWHFIKALAHVTIIFFPVASTFLLSFHLCTFHLLFVYIPCWFRYYYFCN